MQNQGKGRSRLHKKPFSEEKKQNTAKMYAKTGAKASVKAAGKSFLGKYAKVFLQAFSEISKIFVKKPAKALLMMSKVFVKAGLAFLFLL